MHLMKGHTIFELIYGFWHERFLISFFLFCFQSTGEWLNNDTRRHFTTTESQKFGMNYQN